MEKMGDIQSLDFNLDNGADVLYIGVWGVAPDHEERR